VPAGFTGLDEKLEHASPAVKTKARVDFRFMTREGYNKIGDRSVTSCSGTAVIGTVET
jgi:hypothetical protein